MRPRTQVVSELQSHELLEGSVRSYGERQQHLLLLCSVGFTCKPLIIAAAPKGSDLNVISTPLCR
jgi:hypothetical protein